MREMSLEPRRFNGGPEAEELRRWVEEGMTDGEIGTLYGRLTGQPAATRQNVAYWRSKHGIERATRRGYKLDHSDVRPWVVKMEHTGDGIEHRLYDYSRRRKGIKLDAASERLLDEFLEFLAAYDLVVDYNRDTEDGWLFRKRRKSDDPDNIIRAPKRTTPAQE